MTEQQRLRKITYAIWGQLSENDEEKYQLYLAIKDGLCDSSVSKFRDMLLEFTKLTNLTFSKPVILRKLRKSNHLNVIETIKKRYKNAFIFLYHTYREDCGCYYPKYCDLSFKYFDFNKLIGIKNLNHKSDLRFIYPPKDLDSIFSYSDQEYGGDLYVNYDYFILTQKNLSIKSNTLKLYEENKKIKETIRFKNGFNKNYGLVLEEKDIVDKSGYIKSKIRERLKFYKNGFIFNWRMKDDSKRDQ